MASAAKVSSGRGRLFRRYRPLTAAAAASAAAVLVPAFGTEGPLEGALFDAGVLLRGTVMARQSRSSDSTAIVAVDWRSLRSPRTASIPRALFAPVWAPLVDGLSEAGAKVVMFDFVFQFAGNAFIPNYDRPFLAALGRNRGKVILARTAETEPGTVFKAAAGAMTDPLAVGMSELVPDSDGVVRSVSWGFPDERGGIHPSMMGAALQRMGRAPGSQPVRYLPSGMLENEIPAYSLVDVLSCLDTPDGRTRLREAVEGRVVVVGSNLPDEDRKSAPDRLLLKFSGDPEPDAATETGKGAAACRLDRLGPSAPVTETVPGAFIHAAATASVLENRALMAASSGMVALFAASAAAIGAGAATGLGPVLGLAILGADILFCLLLSWLLPLAGIWLPVSDAILAAIGAMGLGQAARYLAEERQRLNLQRLFGQYLAPLVVEQLLESGEQPKVGGEIREITCMFADLSGFTALSGRLPPDELLRVTNHYLACIVRAVEATGGYVDKFIGDAVMAIWNAPAVEPAHGARAVAAAWAAARDIRTEAEAALAAGEPAFSVKIGINSGPAIVGNVGAEGRFNYTAIGAAVNIASRLEALPGLYGCPIILSEMTARPIEGRWVLCELDLVRVKGREDPVALFLPLAPSDGGDEEVRRHAESWAEAWGLALSAYRDGLFAEAAAQWRSLPPLPVWGGTGPATLMAERAEKLSAYPPLGWTGVWSVGKE